MSCASGTHCQCSLEGRSRRVLIVKKLHPAVTMQSLLGTFGTYGAITGCKVFTHKSGRSAGCASVEFASHQAACTAFRELQGTQLHGKTVCLQWFDQNLSTVSPVRTVSKRIDAAGPMLSSSQVSSQGSLQPATPLCSSALSAVQTPFSMLAKTVQSSYSHADTAMAAAAAAVAAAANQQQVASCQHPTRQFSAPLFSAMSQFHATGLQASLASQLSGSLNIDALTSPGPRPGPGSCQDGFQDPAAMAVAAAAAMGLSAGITTASLASSAAQDMSTLCQLAILQQQQHAAALALQQVADGNSSCNLQLDDQQASPLSPARSAQQQQVSTQAARHNQDQQILQQALTSPLALHQHPRLQLARSMPAELGASLGSFCSSGSQGQLHSSSALGRHNPQREALSASAGSLQRMSPLAQGIDTHASTLGAPSASEGHPAGCELDVVQPSRRSLAGNKASMNAKKQLFPECASFAEDRNLSMLQVASRSCPQHFDRLKLFPASEAQSLSQDDLRKPSSLSTADDTGSSAPDLDALATSAGTHKNAAWTSRRDQHCPPALPADYLDQLQCSNALLHATNEQIAAAAAAAALAVEQQQQLMAAAAYELQQAATSPHTTCLQHQHQRVSDTGCMADVAAKLANIRIRDPRASDSQVLSGTHHQRGRMRILSPSLPGANGCAASQADTSILASVHNSWQPAAAAMIGHQQIPAELSTPLQAAVFKQKQQLQLQVPDFELISAPMTCTAVPGGWEHTLIGTDFVPESPAAVFPGPRMDMHAAILAASSTTPAARPNWNDSCWSSGSALSALLSPAHVSSLAERRGADPHSTPLAGDLLPSIRVRAADSDTPSRPAPPAASSWANSAAAATSSMTPEARRSMSGAMRGPANRQQFEADSTRHSSLCLDVQQQVCDVTGADQKPLSSSSRTDAINIGSCTGATQPAATVSSEPGLSQSMGSFTFTPHVSQGQPGTTPFSGGGESALITEPFQMPAFFRPSASNHNIHSSPRAAASCTSPSAAVALSSTGAVGCVQTPHQQSLGSRSAEEELFGASPVHEQLHHAASMPASFGQAAVSASPRGPESDQQQGHALPGGYGDVYRQLWASGPGGS